ncbi:MAG: nuclear transport factor 2 family protein [Phycisphaerales bacterium]|nr:nuclear transport factor 2 family protein [Phycisphaerales bacterium]
MHRAVLILAAAAFAGLILLTVRPTARIDASPANMKAVNEVLDDFHDAASEADFDRYFAHFAEGAVFLGTDDTERWSLDEFKDFARPYFSKGTGWTYEAVERHISLSDREAVAWFDERLTNEKLGPCRGSGVLVQGDDGRWRITQYNLTIPIPNELADRVTEMIREHR